MGDLIFIDDKSIANYVMFKLDKIDNGFDLEELDRIDEVVIDYNNSDNDCLRELLKLRKRASSIIAVNYLVTNILFMYLYNI